MKFIGLNGKAKTLKRPERFLIDWKAGSRSKFQARVKEFLNEYWKYDFVYEEFPVVGTKLSLDFYNYTKKIAVEVQGMQHARYSPFLHSGSKVNFLNQIERDGKKLEFCEKNDIVLVEIYPNDKLDRDEILNKFGVEL